ncbi:MAG: hypothetical protein WBF75_13665 [Pseudonocardiaceae bacterium]
MSRPRSANGDLERAWERTGWSRKELARRVNRRGQARGLHLNTDASRVRAWFAGPHPQPPVPAILCELFSEHLGYPVRPEEIGLAADAGTNIGLFYQPSVGATVAAIADLGRNDVHRRNFLHDAPFVAVAAIAPSRDWLLATLDTSTPRPGGRVGHEQVTTIRETFAIYQEADVMRGGGNARHALAQYVTGHVLPLLRGADPDTDTGASLFIAASEQIYLLGWMTFEDGLQALAQRYLVQALRLTQASGDATLGAHVLAGLSDQARMLGHPREALQLATAGRHGLQGLQPCLRRRPVGSGSPGARQPRRIPRGRPCHRPVRGRIREGPPGRRARMGPLHRHRLPSRGVGQRLRRHRPPGRVDPLRPALSHRGPHPEPGPPRRAEPGHSGPRRSHQRQARPRHRGIQRQPSPEPRRHRDVIPLHPRHHRPTRPSPIVPHRGSSP